MKPKYRISQHVIILQIKTFFIYCCNMQICYVVNFHWIYILFKSMPLDYIFSLFIQFISRTKKKGKNFSFTSFFSPLMSPGISFCKLGLCVQINYIFWWFFTPNWWHFRWRYWKYIIKHDEYQNIRFMMNL